MIKDSQILGFPLINHHTRKKQCTVVEELSEIFCFFFTRKPREKASPVLLVK